MLRDDCVRVCMFVCMCVCVCVRAHLHKAGRVRLIEIGNLKTWLTTWSSVHLQGGLCKGSVCACVCVRVYVCTGI